MNHLVYIGHQGRGQQWREEFSRQRPDLVFHLGLEGSEGLESHDVRYVVAWQPPKDLIDRFPNLEVLFSLGAGVDHIDLSRMPPAVKLVRMVEPGLRQDMVEYVVWAVLSLKRQIPTYLQQQNQILWKALEGPQALRYRVGVMGLGVLGQAVFRGLQPFDVDLAGWSRTPHSLKGVKCYAGPEALADFLRDTHILVNLLPLTSATHHLVNQAFLELLPAGAVFINAGRGPQVVQQDLLDALDRGHLSHAILDVTDPEPLPASHPLWRHPSVWITPHVAGHSHPNSAAQVVLENIGRHEMGLPMAGLVDRVRGY
jgi:glyoxylate/hydroxypyruvate reductase